MMIQEGKRFAGFEGFHPERYLTEFHTHRVYIHPIDAMTDYVSESMLNDRRGRLFFARTDRG
jgi:hypothetical protein